MGTILKSKKKTAASKRKSARKTSSVISLENGIRIVKSAIKRKTSLSAASHAAGRGKNYISDIKARLEVNYKSRNITKELYSFFKALNKQYEKSAR